MSAPQERQVRSEGVRWLDRAENVGKIYYAIWIICAVLLVLELLIDKHVETVAEHWFGFHGFFSLLACAVLVLAATVLRRVVSRPEDYYDDR